MSSFDTVVVVDTETTGFDPATCHLLEVGLCALEKVEGAWTAATADTWLLEYDAAVHGPIPPEAKAVHHILESDVDPAARWTQTRNSVFHAMLSAETPETSYAAHNAAFDRGFLPELKGGDERPWLCTWRCAIHIWPDAPSHKNQVLRYWLGVEPDPEMLELEDGTKLAPHRAQYDAAVTGAVLLKMLETHTVEQLVELTATPVLLTTVRFGKHKGQQWSEVPRDYLDWMLRKSDMLKDDEDLRHTVRHHLGLDK